MVNQLTFCIYKVHLFIIILNINFMYYIALMPHYSHSISSCNFGCVQHEIVLRKALPACWHDKFVVLFDNVAAICGIVLFGRDSRNTNRTQSQTTTTYLKVQNLSIHWRVIRVLGVAFAFNKHCFAIYPLKY